MKWKKYVFVQGWSGKNVNYILCDAWKREQRAFVAVAHRPDLSPQLQSFLRFTVKDDLNSRKKTLEFRFEILFFSTESPFQLFWGNKFNIYYYCNSDFRTHIIIKFFHIFLGVAFHLRNNRLRFAYISLLVQIFIRNEN